MTPDLLLDSLNSDEPFVAAGDGYCWFGTSFWQIRFAHDTKAKLVDKLDKYTEIGDDPIPLEPELRGGSAVFIRYEDKPLCRVLTGPDGQKVYLNDIYARAIEHAVPLRGSWCQATKAGPLTAVIYRVDGRVVGLLMPVKIK